jgi:hypothetical protein
MSWEHGIQKRRKTFPNINKEILDKEGYIEEHEAKILFYKFLRENPSFASELLTGIKLFPFQHMAIKSMMETDYFLGIWCLDQNEYVLSSEGFKKIKDIQVFKQSSVGEILIITFSTFCCSSPKLNKITFQKKTQSQITLVY